MNVPNAGPHKGPLSDIRAVEVGDSVAAAFCGRMLAAFGASVTKIERPPGGSWTRYAAPQLDGYADPEAGALHQYDDMGKRSVVLDWRTPDGWAALTDMIADADALIDDWPRRVRAELGVDGGALERLNPRLINLSLTPFGLSGPYADWQATPLVSLALGGYLYLTGDEDGEPLMLPGYQAQRLAAMKGYAGIMLALRARDATGKGQPVEVSEMETLATLHQFTMVAHTYDGITRKRAGPRLAAGRRGGGYPITTLPCKDGYITFSASAAHQWDYLCVAMGREDLLYDERFASFASLRDAADEIDAILLDWVKDKTRREIVEHAAGVHSVPTSPVFDLGEALADSQYAERGLFGRFAHSQGGWLTFPRAPFHMSATPPVYRPAPTLGQHNGAAAAAKARQRGTDSAAAAKARRGTDGAGSGGGAGAAPSRAGRAGSMQTGSAAAKRGARPMLDGLRVIDLTRVWAGPLAARMLGDFGAHVVKVSDPRIPIDRNSGTTNKLNRNKDHIGLRLDLPEGRNAFLELASASDIVIESFRPHVMRNFGLGYESLRRARPDIIMCSLSGYGAAGAAAEFPAYGTSVESITGLPSLTGYAGRMPMTSGIAYPDPVAGLNAVAAMLTALRHRTATGQGQFIDAALAEGPVCHIGEYIGAFANNGRQPPRAGNSHSECAPHGVYPAKGTDRWIAIAVTSAAQWRALRDAMGRHWDAALDARFSGAAARKANEAELNAIIAEWTAGWDAVELARRLQGAGVPAGAAHTGPDLLNDPHLGERGFFVDLDEPDVGMMTYPGQAIITAGLRKDRWRPSAGLGAHDGLILGDLLGIAGV